MHPSPTSPRRPAWRRLFRSIAVATAAILLVPPAIRAKDATSASPSASARPDLEKNITPSPDYRLAIHDLIQFQLSGEPDLQAIQRISASGEIAVPMLGAMKVGGMTLREAEQGLVHAYVEKGFFVKPQVILSLQTYAPRSVSVLGQVNRPDQIEFPVESEQISLMRAITAAGGFTRIARTDAVRVNRRVGDRDESMTVNVDQFLRQKDAAGSNDFLLMAGDVIFVPERTF